jgi:ornithine cyclodeaminase/alanine dehydrogenase-like protein (mu-crystallin family)
VLIAIEGAPLKQETLMPVLVLTNEEIRTLVPISAYVDAIEIAYREFGLGRAVIQPRTDLYGESPGENRYFSNRWLTSS